ncbi:hypothetical protein FOA52_002856 [Chlamydomonas sp. UWO 241]|nr:hypothetical protein FOA52_002856 [Chlamydomonas sp. UWO 241]
MSGSTAPDSPRGSIAGKRESVRAVAHVRPLLPLELQDGCQVALDVRVGDASISVPGLLVANTFLLDGIVDSSVAASSGEKSAELYSRHVAPLVDGLFAGINATVFAYGQTGAGKSYTMGMQHESARAHACEQEDGGGGGWVPITHAVFEDVAARVERLRVAGTRTTLSCSVFEVHNEHIRDLLGGAPPSGEPAARAGWGKRDLTLPPGTREVLVRDPDPSQEVQLVGLEEVVVDGATALHACLVDGMRRRATAATRVNSASSRSHALLMIHVQQEMGGTAGGSSGPSAGGPSTGGAPTLLSSKMYLVDLAGSERLRRSAAAGAQLSEACSINVGLLALGNVIEALGSGRKHVPYRDNVLTRILRHALGGSSNTLMLACVSPADVDVAESLNTLRRAAKARLVRNCPVPNANKGVGGAAALAAARAEVETLTRQLEDVRAQLAEAQTKAAASAAAASAAQACAAAGASAAAGAAPEAPLTLDGRADSYNDALLAARAWRVVSCQQLDAALADLAAERERAALAESRASALAVQLRAALTANAALDEQLMEVKHLAAEQLAEVEAAEVGDSDSSCESESEAREHASGGRHAYDVGVADATPLRRVGHSACTVVPTTPPLGADPPPHRVRGLVGLWQGMSMVQEGEEGSPRAPPRAAPSPRALKRGGAEGSVDMAGKEGGAAAQRGQPSGNAHLSMDAFSQAVTGDAGEEGETEAALMQRMLGEAARPPGMPHQQQQQQRAPLVVRTSVAQAASEADMQPSMQQPPGMSESNMQQQLAPLVVRTSQAPTASNPSMRVDRTLPARAVSSGMTLDVARLSRGHRSVLRRLRTSGQLALPPGGAAAAAGGAADPIRWGLSSTLSSLMLARAQSTQVQLPPMAPRPRAASAFGGGGAVLPQDGAAGKPAGGPAASESMAGTDGLALFLAALDTDAPLEERAGACEARARERALAAARDDARAARARLESLGRPGCALDWPSGGGVPDGAVMLSTQPTATGGSGGNEGLPTGPVEAWLLAATQDCELASLIVGERAERRDVAEQLARLDARGGADGDAEGDGGGGGTSARRAALGVRARAHGARIGEMLLLRQRVREAADASLAAPQQQQQQQQQPVAAPTNALMATAAELRRSLFDAQQALGEVRREGELSSELSRLYRCEAEALGARLESLGENVRSLEAANTRLGVLAAQRGEAVGMVVRARMAQADSEEQAREVRDELQALKEDLAALREEQAAAASAAAPTTWPAWLHIGSANNSSGGCAGTPRSATANATTTRSAVVAPHSASPAPPPAAAHAPHGTAAPARKLQDSAWAGDGDFWSLPSSPRAGAPRTARAPDGKHAQRRNMRSSLDESCLHVAAQAQWERERRDDAMHASLDDAALAAQTARERGASAAGACGELSPARKCDSNDSGQDDCNAGWRAKLRGLSSSLRFSRKEAAQLAAHAAAHEERVLKETV